MIDATSLALVRTALAEDLAGYGDITSRWTVRPGLRGRAVIDAREEMVVCGLPLAEAVMREIDPEAVFTALVTDGAAVRRRRPVATIEGAARSILSAERTMLNFLIHLSGVATQSRRFAQAVEGTGATVVDTRKTIPGLRVWEKRAVVYGGCSNHRFGLFDMVLIKNNHLEAAGGVRAAMDRVKARIPTTSRSRWRWRARPTCARRSPAGPTSSCSTTRAWIRCANWCGWPESIDPGVVLEASGGSRSPTSARWPQTGVDLISSSALTMGAPPVDLGLTLTVGPRDG